MKKISRPLIRGKKHMKLRKKQVKMVRGSETKMLEETLNEELLKFILPSDIVDVQIVNAGLAMIIYWED